MGTAKTEVAVLMCTYNGEAYLKEQIDSILSQEGVKVDLYIRDDGSSDRTLEIFEYYKDRIRFVNDRKGRHFGAALGFMELLFFVYKKCKKYDYYAFADQDDIWMSNKLETGVKAIKQQNYPCLYCSNVMLYRDGKEIGLWHTDSPDLSFIRHIMGNNIHGCTFVFNCMLVKEVVEAGIPKSSYFRTNYHDSWVILIAIATGKVIYDHKSYILYRIHENNEVGIRVKRSRLEKKRKYGVYFIYYHIWKITALELEKRVVLDENKKNIVDKVANYDANISGKIELFKIVKNHYSASKIKLLFQILLGYR